MIDRIARRLGYVPAVDLHKAQTDAITLNKRYQSHNGHIASLNRVLSQALEERDRCLAELAAAKTTHADAIAVRDREIERLSHSQKPRNMKKVAAALRQPRDGRGFAKRP